MKTLSDKIQKWEDSIGRKRLTLEVEDVQDFIKSFVDKCFELDWDPAALLLGKLAGKRLVGDAFVATGEGGSDGS